MEALTGMMKRAEERGLYYGLKCGPSGPVLSHFLYADDVVFLGNWDNENALNLGRILRCFYLVSGLRVNLNKCHVFGTCVDDTEMEQMAGVLRCRIGVIPFVHLGLQVGRNMNAISAWDAVVELFKKRLSRRKAKSLSVGGRITLIKSVLNSLPTYYFSLFKAPEGVLEKLERLRRIFFWGGSMEKSKINWVAWDKITAPAKFGGLGLGRLRDTNLSLIARWWWRFKTEKGSLW